MTAIAAAVTGTNQTQRALTFGPYAQAGASIKVVKVTPATSNYTAGGVTLDLSTSGPLGATNGFKRRIYWAVPINGTINNGSNTYAQVGYVPGTVLTDTAGGFKTSDGKFQLSTGSTEATAADKSAYAFYLLVCGC